MKAIIFGWKTPLQQQVITGKMVQNLDRKESLLIFLISEGNHDPFLFFPARSRNFNNNLKFQTSTENLLFCTCIGGNIGDECNQLSYNDHAREENI